MGVYFVELDLAELNYFMQPSNCVEIADVASNSILLQNNRYTKMYISRQYFMKYFMNFIRSKDLQKPRI